MFSEANMSQDNAPHAQAAIFDVSTAEFEARVIKPSFERPVIVDFWAPWCAPCKQLMPVLEKLVQDAGGQALLAKVNLDENQELAQALRIQSVPAVFAFFQGRPVDAFQGLLTESQIKAFIDKAVQTARNAQPDALDIPEALKTAAEALAAGDLNGAQSLYMQILQQDEKNANAYVGLVRTFIAAGEIEPAAQLVENAPDDIAADANFAAAKTALEMAQSAGNADFSALQSQIEKNPNDHAARIELAQGLFAAGQKEQACDTLIESIALDRSWNEEEARKTLLKFFEALGHADPLTVSARKKLSSILFS